MEWKNYYKQKFKKMNKLNWKKLSPATSGFAEGELQIDWNQTLMTKINEGFLSNPDNDKKMFATVMPQINVSENCRGIIETLAYYNAEQSSLSKYMVNFDDTTENLIEISHGSEVFAQIELV